MKKLYLSLLLMAGGAASGQEFAYSLGLRSFFDNLEFAGSKVQQSQTMAGTHLAPLLGMQWDSAHRILYGIDALHEWGSPSAIGYYDPVAYYEFNGRQFRFLIGAFPRTLGLERYTRMFFTDSVRNYRTIVNGLLWEWRSSGSHVNVWLDWTSRQAERRREAFIMGWSARWQWGSAYAQHFGYMFHFAGNGAPLPEDGGLHDNGLLLTQVGYDFAALTGLDVLDVNVGWSEGLERERSVDKWHYLHGFLAEARAEWRGIGIFNTYYRGSGQQVFYADHATQLYWGDRIYRSREYDRLDLYVNFIRTQRLCIKLIYSLHFTERTMYHEQSLYAAIDLTNLPAVKQPPQRYAWEGWFSGK